MTASSAGGLTTDVSARAVGRARPGALRRTVNDLRAAWSWSAWPWRAAAVASIGAAIALSTAGRVPHCSGLAVATLVPAALIDVHQRRLPDPLVAFSGVVLAAVSSIGIVSGRLEVLSIVAGAFAMAAPMLVLHVVSPAAMGFGDVKAGLVLGACLGAIHWQLALTGLALAAGTTSVVAILRGRREIAFGPGLVAGALIALAAHPTFVAAGDLTA